MQWSDRMLLWCKNCKRVCSGYSIRKTASCPDCGGKSFMRYETMRKLFPSWPEHPQVGQMYVGSLSDIPSFLAGVRELSGKDKDNPN